MEMLLKKMHEDLKSNGYTNRKLATLFNVSHTTVNSYFSQSTKFDFMHYVETLRLYEPDNINFRRESLLKSFGYMSPNNERLGLEVLNMYGEFELQKILITKILNNNDTNKNARLNKKMAEVYQLLSLRNEGFINKHEFFEAVDEFRKSKKISTNELKIISDFALIYSHLDFNDHKMVMKYTKQLTPYIEEIKKDTLKISFTLRAKEMLATSSHHANELEQARKYCFEIINEPSNKYECMKALAYCILGETYIFEDYSIAKYYFEQGTSTLENPTNRKCIVRKKAIENTLNFLKIYWRKDLKNIIPTDKAEKAFLYAVTNRKEEALLLLDELERENGMLSPIQKYYKGLATGDKKYFEESIADFEKLGDFFYSRLPRECLK
ncbi:AimR family lysis-lysogeny pheromone receptor [Bacillus cereus group sp. TH228LC]|uniref:AimR family lysis-lysogeny pheromone receptor n=1 Tax=Bacillus cereus group sp. TH228LC TaxID=3018049 RepID=UPI0022DE9CFC|nr:AimR family lysis-lysogeny pheromone receptor [Bacillus cereus group sp. TH228LC]MDA1581989.1 AimR family lysis-lysogeny pheromone receptor [Bacillus cereus group sp. TH228LC]